MGGGMGQAIGHLIDTQLHGYQLHIRITLGCISDTMQHCTARELGIVLIQMVSKKGKIPTQINMRISLISLVQEGLTIGRSTFTIMTTH